MVRTSDGRVMILATDWRRVEKARETNLIASKR
jgi:hypothetical protein